MTPRGRKYKKEYAKELLKIAQGDLGSAEDLLDGSRGRPENICYLAQQSIEKSLKAVACHLGLALIHTHDMEALVEMLPRDHRPPEAFELKVLTEYATVRRYEEGYGILSREDLENVISTGREALVWASKKISVT